MKELVEVGGRKLDIIIPDWVESREDLGLLELLQRQVFLKNMVTKCHPLAQTRQSYTEAFKETLSGKYLFCPLLLILRNFINKRKQIKSRQRNL